jgi:1-acyl-sn-glycerol-3-phosphate acyltransferase
MFLGWKRLTFSKILGSKMGVLVILRKTLVTIWFWLGVAIGALLAFLATILEPYRIFDHDFITYNIETYMAGTIHYWMTVPGIWRVNIYQTWKVTTNFRDLRIDEQPVIIAPNHASLIDTLFVALLPLRKTYSYNAKWSWVPVFGWLCILANYVSIDKTDPVKLKRVVPRLVEMVRQKYSIMIYPEGSRSKCHGQLMPVLKSGAFRIALESKRQILPVVLKNTAVAVSRYGVVDIAVIEIKILDLIDPFHFSSAEEMMEVYVRRMNREMS